jgi:hypothetical protein
VALRVPEALEVLDFVVALPVAELVVVEVVLVDADVVAAVAAVPVVASVALGAAA